MGEILANIYRYRGIFVSDGIEMMLGLNILV